MPIEQCYCLCADKSFSNRYILYIYIFCGTTKHTYLVHLLLYLGVAVFHVVCVNVLAISLLFIYFLRFCLMSLSFICEFRFSFLRLNVFFCLLLVLSLFVNLFSPFPSGSCSCFLSTICLTCKKCHYPPFYLYLKCHCRSTDIY